MQTAWTGARDADGCKQIESIVFGGKLERALSCRINQCIKTKSTHAFSGLARTSCCGQQRRQAREKPVDFPDEATVSDGERWAAAGARGPAKTGERRVCKHCHRQEKEALHLSISINYLRMQSVQESENDAKLLKPCSGVLPHALQIPNYSEQIKFIE